MVSLESTYSEIYLPWNNYTVVFVIHSPPISNLISIECIVFLSIIYKMRSLK